MTTPELPDGVISHGDWLKNASDEELDAVILRQLAEFPATTTQLARAFGRVSGNSWSAEIPLGSSINNEADYVDLPFDEASFLALVLDETPTQPALLRLNVNPQSDGSDLAVSLLLPGSPRVGVTIHCEYDVDGDDVVLSHEGEGHELVGRSHTSQSLTTADAVRVLLVVEIDGDAVA